jgi:hypothetical protein
MPNTFLQAWARGVPTVATVDVGVAVHRVARDVEALAREVEAAYEAHPSAACRSYFERVHSGQNVLAHYSRLFERLLA